MQDLMYILKQGQEKDGDLKKKKGKWRGMEVMIYVECVVMEECLFVVIIVY